MTAPSTVAHLDALTATGGEGWLVVSELGALTSHRFRSASFATDEVDQAAQWCRDADDRGHNVYVRTNLLARPLEKSTERGRTVDTGAAVAFAVDLDVAGPGHNQANTDHPLPSSIDEALSIAAALPAPSLTIDTGGGLHLWWILDEPELDRPVELLEEWADRIVAAGAERRLHVDRPDPARVLRVAGTHRRKPNVEPNRVQLVDVAGWPIDGLARRPWCPAGRYGARDLLEALPTQKRPVAPVAPAPSRPRRPGEIGPADAVSMLTWSQILEPAGWSFAGMSTVDGAPVELWRRPGDASSPYSLKAFPDGPAVVWSDACGLPVGRGQRLNKWRIFCHLFHAGDEVAAARAVRAEARRVA